VTSWASPCGITTKDSLFLCVTRVEVHLWQADDERWKTRSAQEPACSGAESFIAGTASCWIAMTGADALYQQVQPHGVIHPNGHLSAAAWGTREFGVSDPDKNLITFLATAVHRPWQSRVANKPVARMNRT
jgi:hypothetical protein